MCTNVGRRIVAALCLAFALCSAARAEQRAAKIDLTALYERAAAEGEVSLYGQGPPRVYEDYVKAFEAKYPKVHVRITPGRYEIIGKIDEQLAAGKLDADLAIVQTVQDYVRWKRAGQLASFAPEGFAAIPAPLKDARGATFLPLALYVSSFAYNPAQVAAAAAPHRIPDFLKPAFKGKIVSTYPHDDDITLYLYTTIVARYGWSFMPKFMAQQPKFVRSHVLVAQETATGDHPVTFDQLIAFNKVTTVTPQDIPMIVIPQSTGIFAKAPHPNAARLFVAYLLSKDYQQRLPAQGLWPVRGDVHGAPAGYKPLSAYRTAMGYIAFVSNTERAKSLRARFESYIGPPQGDYPTPAPAKQQ
jgi:ABC-type Fe3+ transport system substrate-binding protein